MFQYDMLSTAIHRCLKIRDLPLFHGGNRGSNPLGDANLLKWLITGDAERLTNSHKKRGWTKADWGVLAHTRAGLELQTAGWLRASANRSQAESQFSGSREERLRGIDEDRFRYLRQCR